MSVPQISDIILLVIVLISAIKAFKNGFFTAIVDLVGNIIGLVVSWFLANRWAPQVFNNLFRENIVEKTFTYIQDSANIVDAQSFIQQFTGSLPAAFLQDFVQQAEALLTNITQPTMELAETITDTIIGPVVTVVIMIVIFSVCCSVFSLLASLLAKALRAVNHIPVIGFANRMGGFAVGILIGIVDIIVISCVLSIIAIITQNSLPVINMEVLAQSRLLSITSVINPFMG